MQDFYTVFIYFMIRVFSGITYSSLVQCCCKKKKEKQMLKAHLCLLVNVCVQQVHRCVYHAYLAAGAIGLGEWKNVANFWSASCLALIKTQIHMYFISIHMPVYVCVQVFMQDKTETGKLTEHGCHLRWGHSDCAGGLRWGLCCLRKWINRLI